MPMFQLAVFAAAAVTSVQGHAFVLSPRSRQYVAFESQPKISCPHCSLERVPGFNYPDRINRGNAPFAEPGLSTVTQGPCGNNQGSHDYNTGGYNGVNGLQIERTYTAGEVIEFETCWNADHKGSYSIRLCRDPALVAKFTDPSYRPTQVEMTQAEECFQQGILPCHEVGSNGKRCDGVAMDSGCLEPWGCSTNKDWFYAPQSGWNLNNGGLGSCFTNGIYTRDSVRLPLDFSSNHTLLSWRWDTLGTYELYTGCIDVEVLPAGPTSYPTLSPTGAPTPPTSAPTPTPSGAPTPPTFAPTFAPTPPTSEPTLSPTPPPTTCAVAWESCGEGLGPCCAGHTCMGSVWDMMCYPTP